MHSTVTLKELRGIIEGRTGLDIRSKCRKHEYNISRAVFAVIARRHMKYFYSFEAIAKEMDRHHATPIHLVNSTFPQIMTDEKAHDLYLYSLHKMELLGAIKEGEGDVYSSLKIRHDHLTQKYAQLLKKMDQLENDGFLKEVSKLTPEQYANFKERAGIMLKFVKQQKQI